MDAQVLIHAGHEGRTRNGRNGAIVASVGAGGLARPEHLMTPVVADRATEVLRDHGVSVIRVPGVFPRTFQVELGIAIHFDGSDPPCRSGSSVGYPAGVPAGSNEPTARLWKEIWGEYWPFRFMPDNFTSNLRGYYGYGFMRTNIAELLIEMGEISCPEQDAWLQANLDQLGDVVAHFAGRVIGVDIPKPIDIGGSSAEPRAFNADPSGDDIATLRREIDVLRAAVAELSAGRNDEEGVVVAGLDFDADLEHA